ncbi:MAG: SRPBCC domain-containing protein [Bacteroidales bacterium]|nr:SRPBCC domain-containing protein [Bacteroidales bacterium]
MSESFEISTIIPSDKKTLYNAWISSERHSLFTGGAAEIDPSIGGEYTAWDKYIWGVTKELEPYDRIVQTWRTTEFAANDADSILEVLLEDHPEGTKLILKHSQIPVEQTERYKKGWDEHYFQPMIKYFNNLK